MTNEAFLPNSIDPCGIANGAKATDTPETRTRLKRFAPMTFPKDKDPCPFNKDVIAVTSSGRDVPKATKVKAITD